MTGIAAIDSDEFVEVRIVSAGGASVGQLAVRMNELRSSFARLPLPKGMYLLHIKRASGKDFVIKQMK